MMLCSSTTTTALLLLAFATTATAHFGSPRVIGVSSRRRTQAPRLNGAFRPQSRLYSSTADVDDDDDDQIDYDQVVEVAPPPPKKKHKSFKELSFGGKLVRGTRDIVLVTAGNFGLGVTFGLTSGGVRGFPNLMTRKEGLLGTPWKEEYGMRWVRYSGKCMRWAKIWGPVFAVWGFTDTVLSVIRNGENDEFNFMCASSAAAVWHNREKSIPRKVGVAVIYAALTYGYIKFNEYYVVGPEGWEDKYDRNEEKGGDLAIADAQEEEVM